MIPKPAIVTCLLLVVAVLAFAGLAYQTVPVSTTQTITQESTETIESYSPYVVTNVISYTTSSILTSYTSVYIGPDWSNPNNWQCTPGVAIGPCWFTTQTMIVDVYETKTVQSTYEEQNTVIAFNGQTMTSSITESSTTNVPASKALGLTDGTFSALAIVVIATLALLTVRFILRPTLSHRPRQATLSQFAESTPLCIKCGAELPPDSPFCNKCGTEQIR